MTAQLELADIQGNILTGYGRLGFPKGRFLLFHIADAAAGRQFIQEIRYQLTTALRWASARRPEPHGPKLQPRPLVTMNIALTFRGLLALQLSTRTLRGLPDEFIDGMAGRCEILGDNVPTNAVSNWDPVWQQSTAGERPVHLLISLNAQMQKDGAAVPELDARTQELRALCARLDNKVSLLSGHRGSEAAFQEASAILAPLGNGEFTPLPIEHFGYRDGISDPVFEGQYPPRRALESVAGNGRLTAGGKWEPLATGEFLLGHPDEAQEIAGFAMPSAFSRNGTFMAYRKLHQNVAAFRDYLERTGRAYAAVTGIPAEQGPASLLAKIAGRWIDGVPLMLAPTWEDWQAIRHRRAAAEAAGDTATIAAMERDLTNFTYRADPNGVRCPVTSHTRRTNTRDMLDPYFASPNKAEAIGSSLNNRRRLLRRGLPYGVSPPGASDTDEHGVIMMVVCASLFRQFEFVQQQWVQYGLDFNAGNDTCPIIGNHGPEAKFVIAGDSHRPPFICDRLPQFVETRGGDYFFIPSMTSLRMIADGVVDPT